MPLTPALGSFPNRVRDLPGLVLEVECTSAKCKRRLVRIYPLEGRPPLSPDLTMQQVLARCRCTVCRRRPEYLVLTYEGRRDPQFLFMDGTWFEAPAVTIDYDWFWGQNTAIKAARKRER